jgi:hypothetical protein
LKHVNLLAVTGLALTVILNTGTIAAQRDPGPRAGGAAEPKPLSGLSPDLQSFFSDAMGHFMEVDSVSGTISGEGGGQRLFFLHDGRTSDLLQAIQDHASSDCGGGGRRSRSAGSSTSGCGSEAYDVVRRFNSLDRSQMQDVLNFLRSL